MSTPFVIRLDINAFGRYRLTLEVCREKITRSERENCDGDNGAAYQADRKAMYAMWKNVFRTKKQDVLLPSMCPACRLPSQPGSVPGKPDEELPPAEGTDEEIVTLPR